MTTFDPYCLQIIIDLPVGGDSNNEYEEKAMVKSVTQNRRELMWLIIHRLILTRSVLFMMDMIFFMAIPLVLVLLFHQPLYKLTVIAVVFPIYHYLVIDRIYLLAKEKINKIQMLLKQHRRSLRKVIAKQKQIKNITKILNSTK